MTATIDALTTTAVTVSRACALLGMARSTYYRLSRGYRHYQPVTAPVRQADRVQPAALSQAERDQIIAVLDQPEYADLSVVQTYWRAFDTGQIAGSQRTFYRVAATLQLTGDRRRTRHRGHPRKAPAVAASRPDQLWSWDATELKGPGQQRYKLMLILDVYSRYPIGWKIEDTESYPHAVALLSCPKFSGLGCLLFSGGYWIDVVTTQNLVGCLVPECGMKSALIVEQLDPSCNIFVGDLTGRIVFPVDKFHFQRTVG